MKHFSATNSFIVVLAIAALLLGYNYIRRPFLSLTESTTVVDSATPSAQVVDESVERIQKLSSKEKLSQLLVVQLALGSVNTSTQSAQSTGLFYSSAAATDLRRINPGVIVLIGAHTASESAEVIVDSLKQTDYEQWPILLAINQASNRSLSKSESFGVPRTLAQTCQLDIQKAGQAWQVVAQKWQQLGIAMVFGPVVDVPEPGTVSSTLGCQSVSKSRELSKEYVVSFGQYGIMSVIGHFPGRGSVKRSPQLTIQKAEIELSDLEAFQAVLQTYPNIGVLTSTLIVKDTFAEKPCALSSECLAQFPTQYPDVLLIADQITKQFVEANDLTMEAAVREAIMAGNHLVVLDERMSLADIEQLVVQLAETYETEQAFAEKVDVVLKKIEIVKRPRLLDKPANGAVLPILEIGN
jgi:beta-glucosidase-like glycosyl hydrolase